MILLIIAIAIFIIGIGLIIYGKRHYGDIDALGLLLSIIFGTVLFFMLLFTWSENSFHDHNLAMLKSRRDAIVYQMEHELYLGDTLGDFNADVIYHQYLHESPWTNIFIGDYWIEIEPIDVKGESNAA